MVSPPVTLVLTQSIEEAEQLLASKALTGAPVLDQQGMLRGILSQRDIQHIPVAERKQRQVADLMTTHMVLAFPDEPLDEVLERMSSSQRSWMPVVGEEKHDLEACSLVGVLSLADIMRTYRLTLTSDLRRMQTLVKG
jgi:CBS domain-containing protein